MEGKDIGRYHILEQLGEGGMATVYKAYDTHLEAEVAVKVIRTDELPPKVLARALKRFEREAKALARLNHPNIVKVTDYGEYEGQPYLVMPYLTGGTLKERLKKTERMPWQEAARLLVPIAKALDYAHKRGMIHRDVKPSNILITETGEPMLTDFGVAKILDDEATLDLTGTNMAVGTPEYMAPEQVTAKTVDHRADIYALGVVFYEMVTGRKPFQADTPMAVLFKHASEPLPRPTMYAPRLPKAVEQALLKALAKKPENRYQSMGEMAVALERLLQGKTASTKPHRQKPKMERMPFPVKSIWFVLGGVALVSVLLGWLLGSGKPVAISAAPTPTVTFTLTKTAMLILAFTPTPVITPMPSITPTPPLKAGDPWVRPADGMVMHYIPAGEFEMGSEDGNSDELPPHTVYLDAFWMDETEVTNAMYIKCMDAGTCEKPSSTHYEYMSLANHPVVHVSWQDAQAYCEWAGGRLPTEAEWEKAARGGLDGKKYPWGNDVAVCNQSAENAAQFVRCNGHTVPVGSFNANGYGLYDMAGNVLEWVADWYDSDYYKNSPRDNPTGPPPGEYRVFRGGSWTFESDGLRCAIRGYNFPIYEYYDLGFRCARSSP